MRCKSNKAQSQVHEEIDDHDRLEYTVYQAVGHDKEDSQINQFILLYRFCTDDDTNEQANNMPMHFRTTTTNDNFESKRGYKGNGRW